MTPKTSCPAGENDIIRINDLILPVFLANGTQWPAKNSKATEQLISVSISLYHDISRTAESEELTYSINYAALADEIRETTAKKGFHSIFELLGHICEELTRCPSIKSHWDGLKARIKATQPKAFLYAKSIGLECLAEFNTGGGWSAREVKCIVEDLAFLVIIGIESHERMMKQNVISNISIEIAKLGRDSLDFRELLQNLYENISSSNFFTLEALTSAIATHVLKSVSSQLSPVVTVRASKPSALSLARSAEVQITRTLLEQSPGTKTATDIATFGSYAQKYKAAIAIGSNLGDSFQNIEHAMRLLEVPGDILGDDGISRELFVVDTSFLYETAPMYVTDQPSFINCACMVETNIPPMLLLRLLKKIESIVGRVPSIRNGPRAVDLDIVFYDSEVFDTRSNKNDLDHLDGHLVIPHPRVQEREFVLRPLSDMIPEFVHPVLNKSVSTLLAEVYNPTGTPMHKVIPFPRLPPSSTTLQNGIVPAPDTLTHWVHPALGTGAKPHVMATLNVTPDSFSDGATHNALPAAVKYALTSVVQGATIVDIGGYSTRPGAAFVDVEDEIARVVPAVVALRDLNLLNGVMEDVSEDLPARVASTPISVDTFRWEVALAAVKAGANCINDVYAFTGPDSWPVPVPGTPEADKAAEYMTKLKAIAREYAVPVVLMHSRGDAGKNKDYSAYGYTRQATLEGVRVELGAKVDEIVRGKGGVRRWLVIVDPGIGFSKTLEGNLEVLRSAQDVVADILIGDPAGATGTYRNPLRGYMQLIGVSRKSFLGAILAQDPDGRETTPKERTWATAAAVACAVQQKAGVIRVHDVKEMVDVVKVAQALWL